MNISHKCENLLLLILSFFNRTCAVCTLDTRSGQYTHLYNYLYDTLSLAQHECRPIYRINATTYYYYLLSFIKRTHTVCTSDTHSDQYTYIRNYLYDTLSLA